MTGTAAAPPGKPAVLVVEENDAVRGWIHVFGAHHLESDVCAEIGGLVVAEGGRSRGLGGDAYG